MEKSRDNETSKTTAAGGTYPSTARSTAIVLYMIVRQVRLSLLFPSAAEHSIAQRNQKGTN